MQAEQIEKLAVNGLERILLGTQTLSPAIDTNDKTPAWDGFIYVYKSEQHNKDTLYDRIPVQVKGHEASDFSPLEVTHSMDMADLLIYQATGGVILIVVLVNAVAQQVYFNKLLPYDIIQLLKGKENQKSVSIRCKRLPVEPSALYDLCVGFIQDSQKQRQLNGTALTLIDIRDKLQCIESFSVSIPSSSCGDMSPEAFASTQEFYIYAKRKGFDDLIPVEKVVDPLFVKNVEAPVICGDFEYSPNYKIRYEHGDPTIVFGSFSVFLKPEGGKFNYTSTGTLSQRIHDLRFLMKMAEEKQITINSAEIRLNDFPPVQMEKNRAILNYLTNIKKTFDLFEVDEDLDCSCISEADEKTINALIDAAMYGRTVSLNPVGDKNVWGEFTISNLNILFWAYKDHGDAYTVEPFGKIDRPVAITTAPDSEERTPVSQYLILAPENYATASNINTTHVLKSITSIPHSEKYDGIVNRGVLDILCGYDARTKSKEKLLELADKLCDWLLESPYEECKEVYILNKLQTIRRMRDLTIDEEGKLHAIRANPSNEVAKFGADVLLEAYEEAKNILDTLPEDSKNELLKMPIMRLMPS